MCPCSLVAKNISEQIIIAGISATIIGGAILGFAWLRKMSVRADDLVNRYWELLYAPTDTANPGNYPILADTVRNYFKPHMSVEETVTLAIECWKIHTLPGDWNPIDHIFLAEILCSSCNFDVSNHNLTEEDDVMVIKKFQELVANKVDTQAELMIRLRDGSKLSRQLNDLGEELLRDETLRKKFASTKEAITKALFLYGSYFSMAKACRNEDRNGNPIDDFTHNHTHKLLEDSPRQNQWLRAGVYALVKYEPKQWWDTDWLANITQSPFIHIRTHFDHRCTRE